jgi:hypothetical protein
MVNVMESEDNDQKYDEDPMDTDEEGNQDDTKGGREEMQKGVTGTTDDGSFSHMGRMFLPRAYQLYHKYFGLRYSREG